MCDFSKGVFPAGGQWSASVRAEVQGDQHRTLSGARVPLTWAGCP